MSVNLATTLTVELYIPNKSFSSPYPCGRWWTQRTATGDASGGKIQLTATPNTAAESQNFLWSVEQASVSHSAAAANLPCSFCIYTGMQWSGSGGLETLLFSTGGITGTVPSGAHNSTNYNTWLSQMNAIPHIPARGISNSYIWEIQNENALVVVFSCWGYVWFPEVLRLAGGPRRP